MIGILGLDIFDRSRPAGALLNALQKQGFKKAELEFYAGDPEEIPAGFYLLFGSPALKEHVGEQYRMGEVSGEIFTSKHNDKAVILPTYAPGFLYHNPNMKELWLDQLESGWILYNLEVKGVLV